MCGIVGVLGKGPVAELLVDALKRLEYRGYDSTGVATVGARDIERRRAEGKLRNLEALLSSEPLGGNAGIGHTRWATHGKPSEANAHPHMTDDVAVVHNGIIENFRELKAELQAEGAAFTSDTDTEVIAHLITRELRDGKDPIAAVNKVLSQLQGAFALAMIFKGYDDLMIAARQGSPLAIGYGDGEMYVGSDAIALAPFTDNIAYLEDGDWAVITREGVTIHGRDGAVVDRGVVKSAATGLIVDKGNFRHFMVKEIHEQPEVVGHTLAHYLDLASDEVALPDLPFDFANISRLSLSACGTAFYACVVAKYWFERWAKLPVDVDIASEFRYREIAMEKGGAALFVSQSGETADTLASLRYCREQNQHVLSIVNVRESSIARESAWPRRRPLRVSSRFWPAWRSRRARRGGRSARSWRLSSFKRLSRCPVIWRRFCATRHRTKNWPIACRRQKTFSISAVARATRLRSKAR
jgi:glucosamine--fructose-6-phosphate aminotransferase (isomerizing)